MGKLYTRLRRSMESVTGKSSYSGGVEKLIDVKDWLYDTFISMPRRKYEAVQRVVGWIPIIWMNYDWDYNYLFEIMRYKLSRMEKCIRLNGHASNSLKTANEINTAKLVLDRLCDRDYLSNVLEPVDKEYGGWTFNWDSTPEKGARSSILTKSYKRPLTSEQIKSYERELSKAYNHSDYLEKQDIEYLFKFIQKHHKKWWN